MDSIVKNYALISDDLFNEFVTDVSGEFVTIDGDRFYAIRNVDRMNPFFISVVSSDDHWLFASSTGGLTAGRVSPDTALFPYITDDKIHESTGHTGSKTIVKVDTGTEFLYWEPFNQEQDNAYTTTRNLYKSVFGNKLCFEEINHDLELTFRYTWLTSSNYGFVRKCDLENFGGQTLSLELVDGLQNLMPAGAPPFVQTNSSNLLNAYKWTELDMATGLAFLTLYSGITDRAEPCESLRATTVFALGLENRKTLISSQQLSDFRQGAMLENESCQRGIRGAYFVNAAFELGPQASESWLIVANTEQDQGEVVALSRELERPAEVQQAVIRSVKNGADALARIIASADGLQATSLESESVHHFANVLFNVMRGGNFYDQYNISSKDFAATIKHFNKKVFERNKDLLATLPERQRRDELVKTIVAHGDNQLERLTREYLPLTFGRRHGDPSRPWNHFSIKLKDESGDELLSYQGNWRDIFQNWEALTFSYPGFVGSVITKFLNASTVDGYNPYRIGKEGIDWEINDPDDPWSYIGYWGDHQIIYLQKLLELYSAFNPNGLRTVLRKAIFSYANVPYRIKPFTNLLENPKDTVIYDIAVAEEIEQRVASIGADGKLLLDSDGNVYQVNLLEKLLVPLLAKLGNLVLGGGIWLNTQRPEWNDANNALVGNGLSVVTLCYMRRYVAFLLEMLSEETDAFDLSGEVNTWFEETRDALNDILGLMNNGHISNEQRFTALQALGEASSRYRETIYKRPFPGKVKQSTEHIVDMLKDALAILDKSIEANRRDDGLYHAYNLLDAGSEAVAIDHLYPMLEGQVAALSAGTIVPDEAVAVLEALFASEMYRPDQRSFMLYPDRQLPGFLAKNRMRQDRVERVPLLKKMLAQGDKSIVYRDVDGWCRFNAEITNAESLRSRMKALEETYAGELAAAHTPTQELYEEVFQHHEFTGRSGTMFAYEGLGSIYWHMVSKLLLAVQENFFAALRSNPKATACRQLGELYYRVREGLGFNKSPAEYGAFPTDPYSHTPKQAGASQPGMTGQVKEEVLSRFGELGLRVGDGAVYFQPNLLRAEEFLAHSREFDYLDVDGNWQVLAIPENCLAYTWCQVPVIYQLDDDNASAVTVTWDDGREQQIAELGLPADISAELFQRTGRVRQLTVNFGKSLLFAE